MCFCKDYGCTSEPGPNTSAATFTTPLPFLILFATQKRREGGKGTGGRERGRGKRGRGREEGKEGEREEGKSGRGITIGPGGIQWKLEVEKVSIFLFSRCFKTYFN
jgi:hypothetical protein